MVLILGYGSTLRGDDAVGRHVAEYFAARELPGVQSVSVPQLLPELAELIAMARFVIFVDAREVLEDDPATVEIVPVEPRGGRWRAGHTGDPSDLLGMARELYGNNPPAWLVTIPGIQFGFVEALSTRANLELENAVERIEALIRDQTNDATFSSNQ